MQYYLAPMEGVTNYIYRNALRRHFPDGIDRYFTPFIEPHTEKKNLTSRERNDILPEHNEGITLIPQILTSSAPLFHAIEKDICAYGYKELNVNLGCPYQTVVSKGRGSGMLADTEKLDRFLDGIFSTADCRVSLKTRLGISDPEEFGPIMDIYAKYPLTELIIHPRVQKEAYSGNVHAEWYTYVREHFPDIRLVCNGDIRTPGECRSTADTYCPSAVMLGRGVISDPALVRKVCGGKPASKEELEAFTKDLLMSYAGVLSGEIPVLHKMKEFWSYFIVLFPGCEKAMKKLQKSKSFTEYNAAVRMILDTYVQH